MAGRYTGCSVRGKWRSLRDPAALTVLAHLIAAVACAQQVVPLYPNGTPVPVQANAECDSLLTSLQTNDVEEAARVVRIVITGLRQNYPSIRTPLEDLVPSKAEFLGEIHETAASSCGAIRTALEANDPSKAYTAAVRLRMVLERSVADLIGSPQAKFARMEKAVSQLSGLPRFYRLDRLAKAALDANDSHP